ncbi:MAG TPA: FG-GAP repeat protein [Gemmataceae bacterium]|nr:FG-GAP repeat protein [Gemmataceae bacterium]
MSDINKTPCFSVFCPLNGYNEFSTYKGYAYVVFGKSGGWASSVGVDTITNGTLATRFDGVANNDSTSRSVASGDLNGDGKADMIIGAPGRTSNAGLVYVYYGKSTG